MTTPGIRHALSTFLHRARIGREPWRERTLWALDLETGGLEPGTDAILSVGMVAVQGGAVDLARSYYSLVEPQGPIDASSLGIHHILPAELQDAPPARDVLERVAERLDRGILIVHQRGMDIPFLNAAFRRAGRRSPVFAVADTVDLALRYARRYGHLGPERPTFPTGLAAVREWFGLPAHRAHHALSDAVATAELFLVLAHRLKATRLGSIL